MIHAGKVSDLISKNSWSNGTWLFLDIGFSEKRESSGVLIQGAEPTRKTFGEVVKTIKHESSIHGILNLVIESPLSVAFDKTSGNPVGRSIEKQDQKTRYWYTGPGCTVMVATLYLMKAVLSTNQKGEIRLFEGFISYKDGKTDDLDDVRRLRDTVKESKNLADCIINPSNLASKGSEIKSAFEIMGFDFGIPPIIKPL